MRWEYSALCKGLFSGNLEEMVLKAEINLEETVLKVEMNFEETVLKAKINLEETEWCPWNIEEMVL